ncbi:MAG TPA: hypothetical protein VIS74_07985, partial [Chthoniobacterales bacterium]
MRVPILRRILAISLAAFAFGHAGEMEKLARENAAKAILAPETEQVTLVEGLAKTPDPALAAIFDAWQREQVFIYDAPDGARIPFQLAPKNEGSGELQALRIDNGEPLAGPDGAPLKFDEKALKPVETFSKLRRAMRATTDLLALSDPAPAIRQSAILKLGMKQSAGALPLLNDRLEKETNKAVKAGILDAIAIINLNSPDPQQQIAALEQLKKSLSIPSKELVAKMAESSSQPPKVRAAAAATLKALENHLFWVDFFGTMFRGISLGSVLLIVALGLAITFGLMGVINMAHGEIMVVGGYATYLVQCVFGAGVALSPFGLALNIPGFNFDPNSGLYQSYFLFALPVAFLSAAGVGILLERGVIQF